MTDRTVVTKRELKISGEANLRGEFNVVFFPNDEGDLSKDRWYIELTEDEARKLLGTDK